MKHAPLALAGLLAVTLLPVTAPAAVKTTPGQADQRFAQLEQLLPTPNTVRTASGAPGAQYWQQRADYRIKVTLDETRHRLKARQSITYMNRSPDTLSYIWLQLDQNIFKDDSISRRSEVASNSGTRRDSIGAGDSLSFAALRRHHAFEDRKYGYEIGPVRDAGGRVLRTTLNDTMLRIDLPQPLRPGTASRSTSTGNRTSSTKPPSAPAAVTSTFPTATPTSTSSRNGFRGWSPTPTTRAGSTSSSWVAANSRSNSVTTTSN